MIVADTSPLNYLILIERINLLPKLYEFVLIPETVENEMLHPAAPKAVRAWIADPPVWLKVQSPTSVLSNLSPRLGAGEREAISLAFQTHPSFIVLDEVLGRNEAKGLGLPVIGILGVLKEGSERGFLDLDAALDRLSSTSFHSTRALLRHIRQ